MTLHPRIYFIRILLITLVISLFGHLLLIFYLPPIEDMEFLSLKNQIKSRPEPLQITIQGNMENGSEDGDPSEQKGEFGDNFGVDEKKWADLLSKLKNNTGLSNSYKQNFDDINSQLNVKKSYIYRQRSHEDIVIKDVFPTIHNIEKSFIEILHAAPKELIEHNERNTIIQAYRDWKLNKSVDGQIFLSMNKVDDKDALSPLVFPKPKRQIYFDENLPLPKGIQLTNFIRQYLSYDPDLGDLPIATRELYYKNLQRLAYSFSSDPSYLFLDYFLENLNKEDFLKNALYQASKLDGTKTQTELLFALEDIYHIQQRAWRYYFEYDKMYPAISTEKRKHLRNETLKRVINGYKDILKKKNITQYSDIKSLYRKTRAEIFDYIISKSPAGYRRSDALFEKATMLWQQGQNDKDASKLHEAVTAWLLIPVDISMKKPPKNNDNLTQATLLKLIPELRNFLSKNSMLNQSAEKNIQRIISSRHSSRIAKKRIREETLLWIE